jgi:hypothetical protein
MAKETLAGFEINTTGLQKSDQTKYKEPYQGWPDNILPAQLTFFWLEN